MGVAQSSTAKKRFTKSPATGAASDQKTLFSKSPGLKRLSYLIRSSPAGIRSTARTANSRNWRALAKPGVTAM